MYCCLLALCYPALRRPLWGTPNAKILMIQNKRYWEFKRKWRINIYIPQPFFIQTLPSAYGSSFQGYPRSCPGTTRRLKCSNATTTLGWLQRDARTAFSVWTSSTSTHLTQFLQNCVSPHERRHCYSTRRNTSTSFDLGATHYSSTTSQLNETVMRLHAISSQLFLSSTVNSTLLHHICFCIIFFDVEYTRLTKQPLACRTDSMDVIECACRDWITLKLDQESDLNRNMKESRNRENKENSTLRTWLGKGQKRMKDKEKEKEKE